MTTLSPGLIFATSRTPCSAVVAAIGTAAASPKLIREGL